MRYFKEINVSIFLRRYDRGNYFLRRSKKLKILHDFCVNLDRTMNDLNKISSKI